MTSLHSTFGDDAKFIPDHIVDTLSIKSIWSITRDELMLIMEQRELNQLNEYGGVNGLAIGLNVDLLYGLSKIDMTLDKQDFNFDDFFDRYKQYGRNELPPAATKSFFKLVIEAWNDKVLIILSIAALVALGVGIYEDVSEGTSVNWIEGFAIFIAVAIVVIISACNDFQKEKQFRKLNSKKENREVTVVRSSEQVQISIHDVCVGEVVCIATGDVIPADGVLILGRNIQCDESGMTGESNAIKKSVTEDPFLLSGSKVLEGTGQFLVLAVGPFSVHGKIMISLRIRSEQTPLQKKLGDLAENIAKIGLSLALVLLIVLLLKYLITSAKHHSWGNTATIINAIVLILLQAITVVVVAVPEGLPMAVTLALAYSTMKMLQDQNLVRTLAACETMGGATTICTDKTGTLTQNKMSVVMGLIAGSQFKNNEELGQLINNLDSTVIELLVTGIAVNSTATECENEMGEIVFVGSKTETALLNWIQTLGHSYSYLRKQCIILDCISFSSERKRMSTIVQLDNGQQRLFCKGASEIVLKYCTKYITTSNSIFPMSEEKRDEFENTILAFAKDGLRTISLACRDLPDQISSLDISTYYSSREKDMTFLGIVGIEDPLRDEVSEAVKMCQESGIVIRMITGDNIVTARNIAKKCGILQRKGIVIEGPEFRKLSSADMFRILPNLQVLARSSPLDKQILVTRLKEMGETVAVTGDGTNDGPALKIADVGFSMGITGTEVAKEASDIILMDDNFSSLIKAVLWGRHVFQSVQKFLQFQLTVNVTAIILAFISAITDSRNESVLTPIQLLWVNLIMDSGAALVFATEPPSSDLLKKRPHRKKDPFISPSMWHMIIGIALYELSVTLFLLYIGPLIFNLSQNNLQDHLVIRTIVFNTFVLCQIVNEINCRRIDKKKNIFKGILHHRYLIVMIFISISIQVIIVEFGREVFQTTPLEYYYWFLCFGLALGVLPVGTLIRLIPEKEKLAELEEPVVVTHEQLRWQLAINNTLHQVRVVNALRRSPYVPPAL